MSRSTRDSTSEFGENDLQRLNEFVESAQNSAAKVEDGISNVIHPHVNEARMSADEARLTMVALAKRVTYLFVASVAINAATVVFVVATLAG